MGCKVCIKVEPHALKELDWTGLKNTLENETNNFLKEEGLCSALVSAFQFSSFLVEVYLLSKLLLYYSFYKTVARGGGEKANTGGTGGGRGEEGENRSTHLGH
ncbi:unnamed protein product [Arctogadus glacialis]